MGDAKKHAFFPGSLRNKLAPQIGLTTELAHHSLCMWSSQQGAQYTPLFSAIEGWPLMGMNLDNKNSQKRMGED